MIAVVPGYAALVDVEADAPVGGYPGREVRDADRDVIDTGKNGRAYSAWITNPVPQPQRGRPGA